MGRMAVLILGTLLAMNVQAQGGGNVIEEKYPEKVKKIEIALGRAKFSLNGQETPKKPDEQLVLKINRKSSSSDCIKHSFDSGVLKIDGALTPQCDVEVTLDVVFQDDVTMELDVNQGSIDLKYFVGVLDVKMGTGPVTGTGIFERVQAEIKSGNLSLSGQIMNGFVTNNKGNIVLDFSALYSASLSIQADEGDIRLEIPRASVPTKGTPNNSSFGSAESTFKEGFFRADIRHPKGSLIINRKK